ncbi:lipopolysaccharide transport periplasmic protein LptA [Thiomicrorhabdus sp. 6S3-12]|uniref:lipopolysaccharide transport periplasmic protein LptA n=1 Tax=Thiomicrorhabdus sp. 6S3-12 TaxID=2819681 RepID=UPI001AAD0568|nr:lipopolysaccharide transport periplasmic protein LptA [Thiomicrorhabdus sp. 6S3-12]MBO1922967.1 lipopolysaccharide transport periplasmic protein LptA [Thiomicrorhabdus sp. 6S3-12]
MSNASHTIRHTLNKLLFGGVLCLFTLAPLHAEERPSESQEPIKISADRLMVNEKQGVSRYQGNVLVNQGSLQLQGEQIEIVHPGNQLKKIEILGKPARFQRMDISTQSLTRGEADKIIYQAEKDILTFIGNARVEENGKHQISGSKLVYDLQKQTLQAQSDSQKQNRVEVILVPEQKKQ